ncbi:MAG TPA: hypothetical protein VFW33_06285 [Gemmataceae bacterium]|nr:hypothetical protein [Gemmataceae bacterium]
MTRQWHPVFAHLLRPVVEGHYEVRTNVPVGDAPREADIVLLRRTSRGRPPFTGLWRGLTMWNVLEYKGPTVSARVADIDLLVELGLGIHRRLNEERERQGQPPLGAGEVSFWYLANHLGRRFLRDCQGPLGPLEEHGRGVWRCRVLGRVVFLVSGADLPVEEDTLPLHVLAREPQETEREVAEFVVQRPKLWEEYAGWLGMLHANAFAEVEAMAKTKGGRLDFEIEPLIRVFGIEQVVDKLGPARLAEQLKKKRFLSQLSPETCRELIELLRQQAESTTEPPPQ